MSKRRKRSVRKNQSRPSYQWIIIGVVAAILVIAVVARIGREPANPDSGEMAQQVATNTSTSPTPTARPTRLPIGAGDACRNFPRFVNTLDVSNRAFAGTSVLGVPGFAIVDPAANDGAGTVYQHESWDDAGNLGAYAYDSAGNVYTAPAPFVSVAENPPEEQNKVYWIDTDSQAMVEILDLPPALPANGANPFGVVGLTYDCSTESLYAASLMGSSAANEVGRIFQIDPSDGSVLDQLEGIDAMGVGVFNGSEGKRLYFGRARQPEVYSIALDEEGGFVGDAHRFEFSLDPSATGGKDTIRRIRFTKDLEMVLQSIDFNYNLQVASERDESLFIYRYVPETDSWAAIVE